MNEIDEDGNPSQGRSYLYEKARRDAKRKESKGRFEPYTRRPIPKQTAITGAVTREFDCTPVKNEEYAALEILQAEKMLKVPEKEGVSFTDLKPANYNASAGMSMSDKAALNKVSYSQWDVHDRANYHFFNSNCRLDVRLPKRIGRHAFHETFSLTSSLNYSRSTKYGDFETLRSKWSNQKLM